MRPRQHVPPLLAFIGVSTIWGTTWLAIKVGYEGLDVFWGATLRFLLASLILLPWVFLVRRPSLSRRELGVILFVGFLYFGVEYGLVYWAEQFLASGITAVLFSTMPFFAAILAAFFPDSQRVTPRQVVGISVGMVGLILVFAPDLTKGSLAFLPALAIVISAICGAFATLVVKQWGGKIEPIVLTAGATLCGGLVLGGISFARGESWSAPTSPRVWLALGFLVTYGSVLAFPLFWGLVRGWGAHRAAVVTLVFPLVALAVGYLAGEQFQALQLVGSAIVLFGVGLALRTRQPDTPDATSA